MSSNFLNTLEKWGLRGYTLHGHDFLMLMMRSLQEPQMPVWHSEDSVQMPGSEMKSS